MKIITRDAEGNSEITFDVTFKEYSIPVLAVLMDEEFEIEGAAQVLYYDQLLSASGRSRHGD